MKNNQKLISNFLYLLLGFLMICSFSYGQIFNPKGKTPNQIENEKCFSCHSKRVYSYKNTVTGNIVNHRMSADRIINPAYFYSSNHKSFKCTDCHSEEYSSFPHPTELRMEEKLTCIDCHGDDDKYAQFHFEKIEEEFLKSVHSTKSRVDFTCYMCHDAHHYKISERTQENILDIIAYDNSICLSCHSDIDKYNLITAKSNPNILTKHDWLPNQSLHFRSVRCIECHSRVNDTLLTAHNIRPKEFAVKLCHECHSQNSILLTSLYKFESQQRRSQFGFFNGVLLNNSYVIGANRNYFLNFISIAVFCMVLLLIFGHATLRIIFKK